MKKYKLVSAIVAIVIGLTMCPVIIEYLKGGDWALTLVIYPSFAMLPLGIIMLVSGILKNDKNNLPYLKGHHITAGVIGVFFGLLCVTLLRQTVFAMFMSMFYSLMLLSMELRELKYQKGFKQKGMALLISIFAVIYSSVFFLEILPELIISSIFILPALLIVKGVLDIIDAVKPQAVVEEPKAEDVKPVEEAKAE